MRNSARKPTIIVATLLGFEALFGGTRLQAQTSSGNELEESRREVRRLRDQVQSLRAALSEAAELDRQRLTMINRALKKDGKEAATAGIQGTPTFVLGKPNGEQVTGEILLGAQSFAFFDKEIQKQLRP